MGNKPHTTKEKTMKTTKARFYQDLNGATTCIEHAGGSLRYIVEQKPNLKTVRTSSTIWSLLTDAEVEEMKTYYPEVCETCHFHNKRNA